MVRGKYATLAIALLLAASTRAVPPLPQSDSRVHEGVASCASSVCHGKVSQDSDSTVWLNESRVWLRQDYHSRAYRTLQTEQSQSIARKLGLPSAAGAKICLDCHADNVRGDFRGDRFQISDGVGCEACHGGSQNWLKSHAEAGTSHADNIANGMYPTEQPAARAELCLSCHLGTKDKFATHRIMGAGHPRLAFELETFTVNQPAHYGVDDDYKLRKPYTDSVRMWLIGMAISARESAELLQSPLFLSESLVPELSFFQCHDCHHPMDQLRWEPEGSPPLAPGAVRLNDGPLLVLIDALAVIDIAASDALEQKLWALHSASQRSRADVAKSAAALEIALQKVSDTLSDVSLGRSDYLALRTSLLARAGAGGYRHFTAAEQAFLAVETLSLMLEDDARIAAPLDAWFETLADENDFLPQLFASRARQVRAAL